VVEDSLTPMNKLVLKLKLLKKEVKAWEKIQKWKNGESLSILEDKLNTLYAKVDHAVWNDGERSEIKLYENQKRHLLLLEEESWRQKSRTIWIAKGDQNTKFFHRFVNHRKKLNSIWDIAAKDGLLIQGHKLIEEEAVNYFGNLFNELGSNPILDQLHVIRLFPRFIDEESRHMIDAPTTLKEIKDVLVHFSKDKSPGPDGWIVDFFLHFFDLLGLEILEAVEESRLSGSVCGGLNTTFIALIVVIAKIHIKLWFGDITDEDMSLIPDSS